jgi:hypothetical protein
VGQGSGVDVSCLNTDLYVGLQTPISNLSQSLLYSILANGSQQFKSVL